MRHLWRLAARCSQWLLVFARGIRPFGSYTFYLLWALTTIGLSWQVLRGEHRFDQEAAIPSVLAVLACTAALLWWLPGPVVVDQSSAARTNHGWFVLAAVGATGVLFTLATLVGPLLLFALPVVAVVTLAVLRQRISRQKVFYAGALALIAGVAGLGMGRMTLSPVFRAGMQIALVLPGLLAGWSILERTGLLEAGIGRSIFLTQGAAPTVRGFMQRILIGIPWALLNVSLGGYQSDGWVHFWWQPLVAIQPGIAEEAWARVFLVPLLFLVTSRAGRTRIALTSAVVITSYWFAYLHNPGNAAGLVNMFFAGTLYALPLSYLWLRSGLETAIGFHFWIDFVRFVAAYLLNQGFWPT